MSTRLLRKKPKPNKNWMKGFVIEPRLSEADLVSIDGALRRKDKAIKAKPYLKTPV